MFLKNITLNNFRLFDNVEINFHPQMNVFVGQNGSGKTTILDAIAISIGTFFSINGLMSREITENDIRLELCDDGASIQMCFPVEIASVGEAEGREIKWKREKLNSQDKATLRNATEMLNYSRSCQNRLNNDEDNLILPIFVYYNNDQIFDSHIRESAYISLTNSRIDGYVSSLEGDLNIKSMMNLPWPGHEENRLEFDIVLNAIKDCFQTITSNENINAHNVIYSGIINDDRYINKQNVKSILSLMSTGYKKIVSLVADIAYRMVVLNPQLKENALKETSGIILIDGIDLHLYPSWHKCILANLQNIFPKVQFIISTYSPEVINSVSKESVHIIKPNNSPSIFNTSVQTYGRDANDILEIVMNVKARPDEITDKMNCFYQSLDENDLDAAEQILSELESMIDYDPELVSMRTSLMMESYC